MLQVDYIDLLSTPVTDLNGPAYFIYRQIQNYSRKTQKGPGIFYLVNV